MWDRQNRPRIYPVFLPHAGCPYRCVYCNQYAVTGSGRREGADLLRGRAAVEDRAERSRRSGVPGEIAFYGGTFTALPEALLDGLLEAAAAGVRDGVFTGIRFSTRPDAVSEDTVRRLQAFPIRTVELGAQSLSDAVLFASRRGYRAAAVEAAARRVRAAGWALGIQLMVGLPGETPSRFQGTISKAVALRPDFVRLYPALVLRDTGLARWFESGRYRPLSLDQAVERCAFAFDRFLKSGISVARMGLHADPELDRPGTILAGPCHPAFGYLVRVRWWRNRVDAVLERRAKTPGRLEGEDAVTLPDGPAPIRSRNQRSAVLHVPSHLLSEALGPRRENVTYWARKWGLDGLDVRPEAPAAVEGRNGRLCVGGEEFHL
ncbi:MAG: radical SAM protein [Thermodesulfobacteriota bacterium]|nr:radical SAM protein [Thermodesulfobacteriota bacterium]